MKKIDKLLQIKKANILAEQRYIKENSLVKEDENSISPEAAVEKAMKVGNSLNNSQEFEELANKIANNPNLVNQLNQLISANGVSLNESTNGVIDMDDIKTLALNFARKSTDVNEYRTAQERSYDDKPEDEGKVAAAFGGAFGGGLIGSSLSSAIISAIPSAASIIAGPAILGAIAGIALGILAVKVYHKVKGTKNQ
jgi:hypothetical protein